MQIKNKKINKNRLGIFTRYENQGKKEKKKRIKSGTKHYRLINRYRK